MLAKLLLWTDEDQTSHYYLEQLTETNVQTDVVHSAEDFFSHLYAHAYNGCIIELKARSHCCHEDKERLLGVQELFPLAIVRWNPRLQKVHSMFYGQQDASESLKDFVENKCYLSGPRTLRSAERFNVQFNVVINTPGAAIPEEKTVTVDVSDGGAFLFSLHPRKLDDKVELSFCELDENPPVIAKVKWSLPWGCAMRYPGIGVAFTEISTHQQQQLYKWFI